MFPGVTTFEQTGISQATFEIIFQNLVNLGALSFKQYLDGDPSTGLAPPLHTSESPPSPPTLPSQEAPSQPPATLAKPIELVDANSITRLHQACQRTFRNSDALRFEFIEQNGSNKQCILTITKPDGVKRSYATQSVFAKKNEAKAEAARIAIEMGALEFLNGGEGDAARPKRETATTAIVAVSKSVTSSFKESTETSAIDEVEKCCVEWRAGRVTPHWIAFFEAKLGHTQGCALRIQLSPHLVRVYLSEATFDSQAEAKGACARAAVSEGVLDFIKHGNGQTRPASPTPLSFSATTEQGRAVNIRTPWTLQIFYESLPRPFTESLDTSVASEINAPGWLNTMVQNARGGKLRISFFFTSGGTPGLHGCLLKLDRPEDYRAYLVDARFPKRSDAKAAVCLQAMSQGVGDYIRSITLATESKVTPTMRSFSNSLVYPALTSELGKIADDLQPHFDYDRERDAFGATLVVKLSTMSTPEQVQSYRIPCDYRNKADAKVAVICYAAELGVVEFVRFRGGSPPLGYASPYMIRDYVLETLPKRKQPGAVEDLEEDAPARKRKKGKHREAESQGGNSYESDGTKGTSACEDSHQTHGVPGPGDIGLMQGFHKGRLSDQSRPGNGNEGGYGTVHSAASNYGPSYGPPKPVAPYSSVPDPRFGGSGGGQGSILGYGTHQPSATHGANRPHLVHIPPPDHGPSRTRPSALSATLHHYAEHEDLESGEVLSSSESEFSGFSGRVTTEQDSETRVSTVANITTVTPHDEQIQKYTSHVKRLADYCVHNWREPPTFHQARTKDDDKFEAWIVIGRERFDLPRTYATAEEGWQRVAKQVLARLSNQG